MADQQLKKGDRVRVELSDAGQLARDLGIAPVESGAVGTYTGIHHSLANAALIQFDEGQKGKVDPGQAADQDTEGLYYVPFGEFVLIEE